MKKNLLFILTATLLFALVSCGTKETKQFKDLKANLEDMQQKLDAVSDCEDINLFGLVMLGLGMESADNYAENEKMTEEEKVQINNLIEAVSQKADAKYAELGCAEAQEDDFEMMDSGEDGAVDLVDSVAMD